MVEICKLLAIVGFSQYDTDIWYNCILVNVMLSFSIFVSAVFIRVLFRCFLEISLV